MPLGFSEGRDGFTPVNEIQYSSGLGNGIFGAGWSYPIPSIFRKTDKGVPRYHDPGDREEDVFIMAGAEDLVPSDCPPELSQWIEDQERAGCSIRCYRPRVEGAFARIERWQNTESGVVHWRSISKENVTSIYGLTDASRVEITEEGSLRTFEWLLERRYDDRGNEMVFHYKTEDESPKRYLKRIQYGNRHAANPSIPSDSDSDFLFDVVFDYGEHGGNQIEENSEWKDRLDPFSSFRSGFEIRTRRLCRRVLVFHRLDSNGDSSLPRLVRCMEFEYDENPYLSKLQRITRRGYGEDGSSRALPPLELTYAPVPDLAAASPKTSDL
ncbi:MAG: hypothetical protein KC931_26385, partial [Candidatus Omnitrophica bacterium]|nr:hypothetical protein [Candidatus Omnitrophota bacterium]